MPLVLNSTLYFPPLHHSTPEGLLAVGGDLRVERLVLAYSRGIFPWYDAQSPILWWAPPERCILPLRVFPTENMCTDSSGKGDGLYVSQRLARKYKNAAFRHTFNTAFASVIEQCAKVPRAGQDGTWITSDMQKAYIDLHEAGYAHSVECWHDDVLIGGLYGVALGKAFFGESMFHIQADASKMALITLVQTLQQHNFCLLDCQQATAHMMRMGASLVSRDDFTVLLKQALEAGGQGLSSLAPASLHRRQLANFSLFKYD